MIKLILSLHLIFAGIFVGFSQQSNEIQVIDDIQLIHLQDSVFVHVTWHESEKYGRFPSNGMLVIKDGQALMVDTPMDNETTEELVNYINDSLNVTVKTIIVGHFHDDCLGGLEYLQNTGVRSIANSLTINKCKKLGLPVPSVSFSDSMAIDFNGLQINCRYFGAGHTIDNIIVWLPQSRILFGGCLVKSMNSKGLGNLADAIIVDWDTTIEGVLDSYSKIDYVIPGHGAYGGKELLHHTIQLVKKEKSQSESN